MSLAVITDGVLASIAPTWELLVSVLAPVWIEVSFLFCFFLGFVVLRIDLPRGSPRKHKGFSSVGHVNVNSFDPKLQKAIEAEVSASSIVSSWRQGQECAPTPVDLLRPVVQAMLEECPNTMVDETIAHVKKHSVVLANTRTVSVILDVVARAGHVEAMKMLADKFQHDLGIPPSLHMYEVLLGGYATAGDERSVEAIVGELERCRFRMSARGLSLTIKGFLKNGKIKAVIQKFKEMHALGVQVPPFAVTQLFRIACEQQRCGEVFNAVSPLAPLSPEVVSCIFEDCNKRDDLDLARRVEQRAREEGVTFSVGAFDSLLKLYVARSDPQVVELFNEMQASGVRISEGLCVGLLARCAEVKFLRFAEEVHKFCRSRGTMTIAVYSSLMKVYAYCNMYDKACGLYDKILEEGLEPDSLMYGCLMKFAVECGRTDLSNTLAERAPSLDIQNYMSLIRAAGRDRDVDRAFAILDRLKASHVSIDVAAYNCVLDVCVSAGEMRRARALLEAMRNDGKVDVISYNTLLKGSIHKGDLHGARELIREMVSVGLRPNDVSYNCLINAAVSTGNGDLREAWKTIEAMERDGVAADHYTVSIMMKALRRVKDVRDVDRIMALLDRTGLDVFSDEILLNTVLETCVRHRQMRRLEDILNRYRSMDFKPSVHTYGTLIKAASTLRRLSMCWEYWNEMETRRGIVPNDIALGCMLDALVTNEKVDQAIQLLAQWKERVPPNPIMYSTIMKGLANTHQASRALQTWHEMRKEGIKMNTVVYNAVIDAQARVGAMEAVSELVAAMEADGVVPDNISLSTIVKGYTVKGDLDKAFEVFRDMQRTGMARDCIVYNTLLDGCTRHSRFDLADRVVKEMEDRDVTPSNFTVGILVKMYGKRRQLNKAFEVIDTVPVKYGFTANAQVKTCLICACLNNNSVDKAFEIFDQLRAGQRQADAKSWGAMISGCLRLKRVDDAVRLLEEAYGLDGRPAGLPHHSTLEAATVDKVLAALAQRGQSESVAIPLVRKLRRAGYKANLAGHLAGTMS